MPAKFSILAVAALPIIPIALACGGDDGNTIKIPDAAKMIDAPVVCTAAMAGYSGLALKGGTTDYATALCGSNQQHFITYGSRIENGSPFDAVFIDLYAGYGVFSDGAMGGTIKNGTFTIGVAPSGVDAAGQPPDDTKYSSCGLCISIWTDLVITNNMISSSADWYYATSGMVTLTNTSITMIGSGSDGSAHFTGTLTNLGLVHVNKAAGGNYPGDTVADPCTTTISNVSFDSAMEAGSAADCAVSGGGESARVVGSDDGKTIYFIRNRRR